MWNHAAGSGGAATGLRLDDHEQPRRTKRRELPDGATALQTLARKSLAEAGNFYLPAGCERGTFNRIGSARGEGTDVDSSKSIRFGTLYRGVPEYIPKC